MRQKTFKLFMLFLVAIILWNYNYFLNSTLIQMTLSRPETAQIHSLDFVGPIEVNFGPVYPDIPEKMIIPGWEEPDQPEKFTPIYLLDTSFKGYMDYRTITDKSSTQYSLQQYAYTDHNGFRKYENYYMVAVGTYYTKNPGELLKIELDSGIVFYAIAGDIKNPIHTNESGRFVHLIDNKVNVVEFIVDTDILPKSVCSLGDVSSLGLYGNVVEVEVIQ